MTIREEALKGIISDKIELAAKQENMETELMRQRIAEGAIAIPANNNRKTRIMAVGKGCSTKINANIGTSEERCDPEAELKKADIAARFGADTLMDLSIGGDMDAIRRRILDYSDLPLGTVPLYAVAARFMEKANRFDDLSGDVLIEEIEKQAQQGVDFMTIHAGITQRSLSFLSADRVMGVVSRGGALLKRWMTRHGKENPFYSRFDEILDICRTHDVTISLGDGFRSGACDDASDGGMIAELLVLGELTKRCLDAGVQVIVEGPGHMRLDQVAENVHVMKRICHGVPYYVLGPLVTDRAAGFDHISAAIGGGAAASAGADFLCYVTPAEHLCLPREDDVRLGVIASRIAADAGDAVKGTGRSREKSRRMSEHRRQRDWEAMFALSPDPDLAKERAEVETEPEKGCTMCGKLCSIVQDTAK